MTHLLKSVSILSRFLNQLLNTLFILDKAKKAAEQKAGQPFGCNFHDIKAKSISDYAGSSREKRLFSGHKTESQVVVYDRKVKIIPSVSAPLLKKKA